MLTVIIETRNDEAGLAQTLGSLVSAAVDGVVRDVIVVDRDSSDQTLKVADHAGCTVVSDLGSAIAHAKAEWLLVLEPGARLVEGWVEPVAVHIARATLPARFTRRREPRRGWVSRLFGSSRALAQGLLIRRAQAAALAKSARDVQALARGLASRQLPAEIRVAEREREH